jgi:gamma-glutamylcysteine synthetase
MEDFDVQISLNGNTNEVFNNFVGEPDGESNKNWIDTLNQLTEGFKDATDFKTNEQTQKEREEELAQRGIKYKVLGMNPFVAIGVSLVLIIGGSYVLTRIKAV